MIEITHLYKTYPGIQPVHALQDLTMSIGEGEFVSVMGASGSGKSTLLNILGMLDDYESGTYYLDGQLIRNLTETKAAVYRNNLIGFVFQSFNLISFKNALDNVALPLYYKGVPRKKRNLLVYCALILFFSLVAYQAYSVSLGPNYVSFSIQKTEAPIFAGQQNMFSVTCNSDGARDIAFYMVIQCTNATLQVNGQQGYLQVSNTAVKIPFSFHGDGSETKPVYFTADSNVSSISFYPSVEAQNGNPFVVEVYLREFQCTYDAATASYIMADSSPVAVP